MKIIAIFPFMVLSFLISCSDEEMPSENDPKRPRFRTTAREGRWQGLGKSHVPQVTFVTDNRIKVTVPLQPRRSPKHYIEFVALLQNEKQVAIKRIPFTLMTAQAWFDLPDGPISEFRVVAKCNLHGMWGSPLPKKH